MKTKSKFSITQKDEELTKLVSRTDQKTLARWAIECAERVMPYFEKEFPKDTRPRDAIETLKTWIKTGVFKMAVIRKASLDAHAAARDVGQDSPARSAARAAGQAVATAHVPRHAYGPAIYAQQAIFRAANPEKAMAAVAKERQWQLARLTALRKKMQITNNVTRMLVAKGIAFDAHELPEEKLGGVEAAEILKVDPSHVFKTIVALRPDGGKPVLALIPAPAQLDLKAIGRLLGGKKLQVASQSQAENLTGLQVGGISPLALVGMGFEIVIDEKAFLLEKIYLSGGQRGLNLSMTAQAVKEFTRARVGMICKPKNQLV